MTQPNFKNKSSEEILEIIRANQNKLDSDRQVTASRPSGDRQNTGNYYNKSNKEIKKIKQSDISRDTGELSQTQTHSGSPDRCRDTSEQAMPSSSSDETQLESHSVSLGGCHQEGVMAGPDPEIPTDAYYIKQDEVIKAFITFYYEARGRNKHNVNIQLNLDDGSEYRLVSNISLDKESLKKFGQHIPEKVKIKTLNTYLNIEEQIKLQNPNSKIFGGKIRQRGVKYIENESQPTPVEEDTICLVWFDRHHKEWQVFVKFQNWQHQALLSTDISEEQKKSGAKAHATYFPEYKFKQLSITEQRKQAYLNKLKAQEQNNEK